MKKVALLIIALILVFAMTIALTACGNTETAPIATPPPAAEATPTPTPEPEIEPIHETESEVSTEFEQWITPYIEGVWERLSFLSDIPELPIIGFAEKLHFSVTENGERLLTLDSGEVFEWSFNDEKQLVLNPPGNKANATLFHLWGYDDDNPEASDTLAIADHLFEHGGLHFSRTSSTLYVSRYRELLDSIRGVVDGNTYKSEYLGFSITVPDDWEILDESNANWGPNEDFWTWDEYGSVNGMPTIWIRISPLDTPLDEYVQSWASNNSDFELLEDKIKIGDFYWNELVWSDDVAIFLFAESRRIFITGDIDNGILIEMEINAVMPDVEIAVMKSQAILSLITPYP